MQKSNLSETVSRFRSEVKKGLQARIDHKWHKVAPYLEVKGLAREEGNDQFLVVIDFIVDRHIQRRLHPRKDILNPSAIIAELVNMGYDLPPGGAAQEAVELYLTRQRPSARFDILRRSGWWKGRYIRPDGKMIPSVGATACIFEPHDRKVAKRACDGSLLDWQRHVAGPATHSTPMMFMMAVSFAALIIDFTQVESGMFHLYGRSTAGKTLTLCAALSIHQRGTKVGMRHWDFTKAGFEELAAAYCDRFLPLDEAGHINTDIAVNKLRETAFMMTAGSARIRSKYFKGTDNDTTWKLLVGSSGEIPVSNLAIHAGRQRIGGEEVRLIDVPATVSDKYGVFETVPNGRSSAELAAAIEEAADKNYGYPAEAFLHRLGRAKRKRRQKKIQRHYDRFFKKAHVVQDPFERRFASRFALAYAAVRMAIEWEILPWTKEQAFQAIEKTYRASRVSVPNYENLLNEALKNVRHHLRSSKRIVDVKTLNHAKDSTHQYRKAVAFRKTEPKIGEFYAVKKEAMQKWIGPKISLKMLDAYLLSQALLVTTKRKRAMKQVSIPGAGSDRPYFYCFKKGFVQEA